MSLNVFGCPDSSLNSHRDVINNKRKEPKAYDSCGIWTQASYINHSCTSTARRAFIGDMMIVRAARDLKAGAEITFWYYNPSDEVPQKIFQQWGFRCDCTICEDIKATHASVITARQRLFLKMKRIFESTIPILQQTGQVERLLDALKKTYVRPAHEVPRFLLWDPQLALAHAYFARREMNKSLEAVGKTLTLLGFTVVGADSSSTRFRVIKWGFIVDHLVSAFLRARDAFAAMKASEDAKRAVEYARTTYKIVVGEDASFDATYG